MKYLVTGATGFIGTALCRQILLADAELLAYSASGKPLADGTPTRALDLAVEQPDSQALAGVDAVLHLAGIAHRDAPADEYEAVNHRATIELARRAARAGVGAFIFLSSVKAMGPVVTNLPRSEHESGAAADPYGRSKRAAELALAAEFAASAMSVVILRPALVYGSGARGNLALLSRAVARGLPRPPEDGGRSMVGREDLAQLMLMLAASNKPGVSTYIATDGETYSTRRIYDALRRARGLGPGSGWCPRWGWRLACRLLDLRSPHPEPAWQRLFGVETYSGAALRQELGWRPRQTLETVLQASGGTL
ncbi:NAD-dependent epimerase/dehydratase family protein [Seongchinamella sediminis]|uniref:NAD-dependent epimerase/dehydratase family protein n=1 Tax=Seongchinamella sediminis TaxID=2283635 RepID=A0A3L7E2W8_9GAMM|nr:NAD-dependent epimerase/dehydratase family protein [Seongchinamella sediminis]RLQ22701.1 NAD-dependent epimerase/dehydratase family protein [Seongchinamella sediminis]